MTLLVKEYAQAMQYMHTNWRLLHCSINLQCEKNRLKIKDHKDHVTRQLMYSELIGEISLKIHKYSWKSFISEYNGFQ